MSSQNVKFVVFVPIFHAEAVRQALGEIGAGKISHGHQTKSKKFWYNNKGRAI